MHVRIAVGFDPSDNSMHSRNFHFNINASAPPGQGSFFDVVGFTIDPFRCVHAHAVNEQMANMQNTICTCH
jgi:hypothetical protein